jgi:hypothetical protein
MTTEITKIDDITLRIWTQTWKTNNKIIIESRLMVAGIGFIKRVILKKNIINI